MIFQRFALICLFVSTLTALGSAQVGEIPDGYQIEIDDSERQWTGGLYEERARGWITPLVGDGQAKQRDAFKHGSMACPSLTTTITTKNWRQVKALSVCRCIGQSKARRVNSAGEICGSKK